MIFNKIGFSFSIALVSSMAWTFTFQENTAIWIGIAVVPMLGFFWGSMNSLLHILSEKISLVEMFVMRIPFSILAGSVTYLTFLNIYFILRDLIPHGTNGVWTIILLIAY